LNTSTLIRVEKQNKYNPEGYNRDTTTLASTTKYDKFNFSTSIERVTFDQKIELTSISTEDSYFNMGIFKTPHEAYYIADRSKETIQ